MGKLSAQDPDGDQIIFELWNENLEFGNGFGSPFTVNGTGAEKHFSIDPDGTLKTATVFDFENPPEFFVIQSPPPDGKLEAQILVRVKDVDGELGDVRTFTVVVNDIPDSGLEVDTFESDGLPGKLEIFA